MPKPAVRAGAGKTETPAPAHQDEARARPEPRFEPLYNVVLSGELVLILESGEVTLKAGDVVVQRNTLHAWRNNSTTDPIRWLAVLLPIRRQV